MQKVHIADALNRRAGQYRILLQCYLACYSLKINFEFTRFNVCRNNQRRHNFVGYPYRPHPCFFLFRFLAYYSAIMLGLKSSIRVNCASPSGRINRVSQKIGGRLLPKLIFLLRCLWHGAPQSKATVQSCEPDLNSLA